MRILWFIALLAICGCSPSSKDIVGDWARPMGLRIWDGKVTGEDFVIRLSADGTYRVFDDGSVYRDQFTDSIYFYDGNNPPKWTGKWRLQGKQISFHPDGHTGQIEITIEHFSSSSFVVSYPWSPSLRSSTYYRVTLTDEYLNVQFHTDKKTNDVSK